jgi:hypothetical protein
MSESARLDSIADSGWDYLSIAMLPGERAVTMGSDYVITA